MHRLLLFIFSFIFCNAFGQEPYTISLRGLRFENTTVDFKVEKIIDAREFKDNIGYTFKGALNRIDPVYFARPAEEELLSLFYGNILKSQTVSYIIRIDHLYIYELSPSGGQIAYVELNLSFISTDTANQHYLQFESAVLIEDKIGVDVTRGQSKNIMLAVEKSVKDFMKKRADGKLAYKHISKEEVLISPFSKRNYKILEISDIPAAIFPSFYDFRDYRPHTTRKFITEYKVDKQGNSYATLRWDEAYNDASRIDDIWGVSDGKNIYIRINKTYYPLTREGNNFTIYSNYWVAGSSQGASMGLMFGAIGGLISGLAQAAQSDIGDFKCTVNFADGSLIPVAASGSNTFGGIFLYFTSYSQDGNISVLIDDDKKCEMPRDTYFRHSQNDGAPQVNVCLQVGDNKICEQVTANSYNDRVYICKIKKGVPVFDKISSELQSTLLNEIYQGKYNKSCE